MRFARSTTVLLALALLAMGTGCDIVFRKPVGKSLPREELKKFEGDWYLGKPVSIALGDEHLVMAGLDFEPDGKFVAVNADLHFMKLGEHLLAFMRSEEDDTWTCYLIDEATADKIVFRIIDPDEVIKLIDAGVWPGERREPKGFLDFGPRANVDLTEEAWEAGLGKTKLDALFPQENGQTMTRLPTPKTPAAAAE